MENDVYSRHGGETTKRSSLNSAETNLISGVFLRECLWRHRKKAAADFIAKVKSRIRMRGKIGVAGAISH